MIRRKSRHSCPHPNYNERDLYTLKLNHGGTTLNDCGKYQYIGGTTSMFDFVDGGFLGLMYLNGLSSTLGYQGSKKYYASCGSDEYLLCLEKDEDFAKIKNVAVNRELIIYLHSKKNGMNAFYCLEDDICEGDIDNLEMGMELSKIGDGDGDEMCEYGFDMAGDERVVERYAEMTDKRAGERVDKGVNEAVVVERADKRDGKRPIIASDLDVEGSENDENDEEFDCSLNVVDEMMDAIIFEENVDTDEEYEGLNDLKKDESSSESSAYSDLARSGSDFESIATDVDDEGTEVDTSTSSHGRSFILGKKYSCKAHFKDDVNDYAVKVGRACKFVKNDNVRIYAKCKKENCGWHIHVRKIKDEESFQIREMDMTHSCPRQHIVANAKSSWLAKRFESAFRCDPKRTASGFRKSAMFELGVHISPQQAFRTRQKALKKIEGETTDQYAVLWDYAEELREKNPGSTIILQLETTLTGKNFKSLYICLAAVKHGFRSGCRPWIGVDGCHLTGPNAGVLLTAVGMDPNNDPFPLAYAVVGIENRESWEWFLTLLKEDLVIEREDLYTFMSDKQKGLLGAFEKVLPNIDNRFCVLHLHGNMKRAGFRGHHFRKMLWNAAKATTVAAFKRQMGEIEKSDANLYAWLMEKPATQWSKSHFTTFCRCDTLVNNMCEQINNCLLDARDKPIVHMLEWIRQFIMKRLERHRDKAERKWEGRLLCPKISKILSLSTKKSSDCIPMKSSFKKYEVQSCDGSRVAVDLEAMTCDCRSWDLSGIPCKHAVSAISAEGEEEENYVHKCYRVETYNEVYKYAVHAMYGPEFWKKTGYVPPLPPNFHIRKKGRPQKQRKRGSVESPKTKRNKKQKLMVQSLGKQKFTCKCHFCGEPGHNKLGCPKRKEAESKLICTVCLEHGHIESHCPLRALILDEYGAEEQLITQPDLPPQTQEPQEDLPKSLVIEAATKVKQQKPTTRKGRQDLAKKRMDVAASSRKKKDKAQETDATSKPLEAYSLSNSLKEKSPDASQTKQQVQPPTSMCFKTSLTVGENDKSIGKGSSH